jgi:hypothetical protein
MLDPAALTTVVPITATSSAGRPSNESTTTVYYYVTDTARTQILHYRGINGTALIVNVHITHHAGTTFCAAVGRAPHTLGAPSFACMGVRETDNVPTTVAPYPSHRPWQRNETGPNIATVRQFFHMISWEFGWHNRPQPVLGRSTDWEHPQLVSVYISKHPLERMLASGSAHFEKRYPGTRDGTANETEWWRFAKDPWNNNYALRILSDSPACCDDENTTVSDLESAQALLRRFTFVLDVHCLDANLQALAAILGIELKESGHKKNVHHKPLSERIPYPAVYDYLAQRNRRDIELYEWSKGLSLVNCEALEPHGT